MTSRKPTGAKKKKKKGKKPVRNTSASFEDGQGGHEGVSWHMGRKVL